MTTFIRELAFTTGEPFSALYKPTKGPDQVIRRAGLSLDYR